MHAGLIGCIGLMILGILAAAIGGMPPPTGGRDLIIIGLFLLGTGFLGTLAHIWIEVSHQRRLRRISEIYGPR